MRQSSGIRPSNARTFLLCLGLLFASSTIAHAQARLTGIVRDSAGTPLAGAEVSVQGVNRTTTTNTRGEFQLGGIKAGNAAVNVRRLGYAPFSTVIRFVDGDNRLPDVKLVPMTRELDTVATREQQLWREYPLLREFEDNRRIGLGQFITREQLSRYQGGFLSPVLSQLRGLIVVRGGLVASHTWLATIHGSSTGCTELEDRSSGESISPRGADCNLCFPAVYLDYTLISSTGRAPNISAFSPDQLHAIEVYLGPAETPLRYSGTRSGCGVIVLHSRKPDAKPRVIANPADGPVRSRVLANVSVSAGRSGAGCPDCGAGGAIDGMLGYTFRDRWVIGGRYAQWKGSADDPQTIVLRHALLEWYPRPDPGRFKWFVNVGAGSMSVSLHTAHETAYTDEYNGNGLPSFSLGTGVDISAYRRLVMTPFISHARTTGGRVNGAHCVNQLFNGATVVTCYALPSQPRVFNLTQVGTRIGWR